MGNIIINANRILIVALCTALTAVLSGCVTQQYVVGSDNTVKERVMNTREAAMARLKLALEYLRTGQTAQAKLNLERALRINSDLDGIHSSFAYYYQQVGEYEQANDSYIEALEQYPENANTRNNYGAFLCDQEHYEAANKQFVRAISTSSNTTVASSYENAGLCALRNRNWDRAKYNLKKVLAYEANRARSILGLSKANLATNNIEEASRYLRNYRQYFAQTPQSLWLAIQIERKLSNDTLAKKLGKILLRNYPKSAESKLYRAKVL